MRQNADSDFWNSMNAIKWDQKWDLVSQIGVPLIRSQDETDDLCPSSIHFPRHLGYVDRKINNNNNN